jgi:hypothetical protein
VAAGGQHAAREDEKPSKKEGCVNGAVDLACCFTTAVLLGTAALGSALFIRAMTRQVDGRTAFHRRS